MRRGGKTGRSTDGDYIKKQNSALVENVRQLEKRLELFTDNRDRWIALHMDLERAIEASVKVAKKRGLTHITPLKAIGGFNNSVVWRLNDGNIYFLEQLENMTEKQFLSMYGAGEKTLCVARAEMKKMGLHFKV